MYKVSVIIPVYKIPENLLRRCFDSLISQTLFDCEFVVVSDGAAQQECRICKEYSHKDCRFIFFENEHAGVSATRNFALQHIKGDYVFFLDADDYIDKNLCNRIWVAAQTYHSDIILFGMAIERDSIKKTPDIWDHDVAQLSLEQRKNVLESAIFTKSIYSPILCGVCCKAYKTAFIRENNIQFNKDLHYAEDQLFTVHALTKSDKISYLSQAPFYHCVYRSNSSSRTYKTDYDKEVISYLDCIYEIFKHNPSLFEYQLFHNRVIECILYTLYICIFRPEKKLKFNERKAAFLAFINNRYCNEALQLCELKKFNLPESILILLCRIKCFWGLYILSKKWYL